MRNNEDVSSIHYSKDFIKGNAD